MAEADSRFWVRPKRARVHSERRTEQCMAIERCELRWRRDLCQGGCRDLR